MTAEIANKIREVLQGYYPGEAYKLTGVPGTRFSNAMMAVFSKTEDSAILAALENVCNSSDTLPSIPMIRKAVKEISNRVPEYVALPEPEQEPVNPDLIANLLVAAKKLAKERREARNERDIDPNDADYYQLPPELVAFARRLFPEISLSQIARNRPELSEVLRQRGKLDGHDLRLMMDNHTGLIYEFVRYKKKQGNKREGSV